MTRFLDGMIFGLALAVVVMLFSGRVVLFPRAITPPITEARVEAEAERDDFDAPWNPAPANLEGQPAVLKMQRIHFPPKVRRIIRK